MTLNKKDLEAIRKTIREELQEHGITPEKYPDMSTSELAAFKKCSRGTVHKNWKYNWRLKCIGNNSQGERVFSGLSVKNHVERMNAKQKGRH